MFELADSLLGVYKVDNMSYSIRIGVNNVVNKLVGLHQHENRAYIMGQDDKTTSGRNATTTLSSQQSTQTQQTQSQKPEVVAAVPAVTAGGKPVFDLSAIDDPGLGPSPTPPPERGPPSPNIIPNTP